MATRRAWVLNLDAERELADPHGYTPSPGLAERIREASAGIVGLLGPDDIVLGEPDALTEPDAFEGVAWCPTPRALALLDQAGVALPKAPPLPILQRVNHRRFCFERYPLPGARLCSELTEVEQALQAASEAQRVWVLKRVFGFSGRGLRRVFDGHMDTRTRRFCDRALARDGSILVEPWLKRTADFVVHGLVSETFTVRVGEVLLQECGDAGTWRYTRVLRQGELGADDRASIRAVASDVGRALGAQGYFGPFGVDAFSYTAADGSVRLRPCVEVNARYCMGWGLGMAARSTA